MKRSNPKKKMGTDKQRHSRVRKMVKRSPIREIFISDIIQQYETYEDYLYYKMEDNDLKIRFFNITRQSTWNRIPIQLSPQFLATTYVWVGTTPHKSTNYRFGLLKFIIIAPSLAKLKSILKGGFDLRLVDDQIDFYDLHRFKSAEYSAPRLVKFAIEEGSEWLTYDDEAFELDRYLADRRTFQNYQRDARFLEAKQEMDALTREEMGPQEEDLTPWWRRGLVE